MKKAVAAAALVLLAACASQRNNANGKVPQPTVTLDQLSSMPAAAQEVTGGIPISLRLTVTNNATIPITLQRAQLESLGTGGWNLRPTQQNFGKPIVPGATQTFDFWVAAVAAGQSVVGAPSTVGPTTPFSMIYDLASTTWYRMS